MWLVLCSLTMALIYLLKMFYPWGFFQNLMWFDLLFSGTVLTQIIKSLQLNTQ